jgi:hypothetical protein
MGYIILTPSKSFVRFDNETNDHCIWGSHNVCLPVYAEDDIAFQFVIEADTEAEADALCSPYGSGIEMGIVEDCDQVGFTAEFTESPERFRLSLRQILYNWPHGVPGMIGNIDVEQCFYIRVVAGEDQFCTNCFQRIPDDCFTSVVDYGNEDNFAGFNYCNSEGIDSDPDSSSCDPTVIQFTNQSSVVIPYTASLIAKYGTVPTVQVWIYVDGALTNVGVVATFDTMPPSLITVDPGGVSSGIVIIR